MGLFDFGLCIVCGSTIGFHKEIGGVLVIFCELMDACICLRLFIVVALQGLQG